MAPNDTGISAYASLSSDINKQKGTDPALENKLGIVGDKLPELTLEMKDEDIVKLTDKWEKDWLESDAKKEWEKQIDENQKYWLGKQYDGPKLDKTRPMVDNLVFESLETFLPQATRRNPEPMIALDASEKNEDGSEDPVKTKYVRKVKNIVADVATKNMLRLKLKRAARHHEIYQIGVSKFGWSLDKNLPTQRIIRPKKMILDPDATIDEDGYNGERIGEYRKLPAQKILDVIGTKEPEIDEVTGEVKSKGNASAVKSIKELVKDDLATEIQFIEWWTTQYVCWKLGKEILWKKKNPHWNYDRTETPQPTDITSPGVSVDDYGNTTAAPLEIEGINHFPAPKMPYEFLVVFNLGDQPMDNTSLIGQNLSNQDLINKRNRQIDKNADSMNGGMVVSVARSGLTQAQAKGVTEALRKGGTVVIPDGSPADAITRMSAPGLPPDVYNQLADTRNRMRDIFGTRGSSAGGLESEDTVRGKILNRGLDTDRIGGGLTEYLELFASNSVNWYIQLLYVYDSNFQFVGGGRPPKITATVKEGSLLPKDTTSLANQALELAKMNKISNLDLYKTLEYPNPEEMAGNVWLEANAPQLLYKNNPLIQEALMMQAQAAATQAGKVTQDAGAEADKKHAQAMEMQNAKADAGIRGEVVKSALSEVPTKPSG